MGNLIWYNKKFRKKSPIAMVQGEWCLSVKSNLTLTDRKSARNFNLIMNSVQGRVGIYASMIRMILSWPLLASMTSFFTIYLFTWLFGQKHQKLQTLKLPLLADLITFSIEFNNSLLTYQILCYSDYFCTIAFITLFKLLWKTWKNF